MKKQKDYTIEAILFCLALALLGSLVSCTKSDSGHRCKWEHCPYKGYQSFPGVIHTGETEVDKEAEGGDTWCIDQLHMEFPELEYDELEIKMWEPRK